MWKSELPSGCPPKNAIEQKVEVYRVLNNNQPEPTDFQNYYQLYPENIRYKSVCKAYALSFYNSIENAISAIERSTTLQNCTHIGKYIIDNSHGVCEFKEANGHYSVWLYNSWNYDNFQPITITPI